MNSGDTGNDGSTPLDPDETEGLLPGHVTSRRELNELEAMNISQGARWLGRTRRTREAVLDARFVQQLHRRMFGGVWQWAGEFRHTEKSIGNVHWSDVPVQLREALADARARLDAGTPVDEVAMRLHHRVVQVHPFANGNGRTARYLVDELLRAESQPAFTWGADRSSGTGQAVRDEYIRSLEAADRGDFGPLRAFVRS